MTKVDNTFLQATYCHELQLCKLKNITEFANQKCLIIFCVFHIKKYLTYSYKLDKLYI